MTDWLFRVGDGLNFYNSLSYKIWGIKSSTTNVKFFMNNVKENDRLWFIKAKTNGKIIAVANYKKHQKRELGPLINISKTNKELGWSGGDDWDIEIIYDNIYLLDDVEDLETEIQGPSTIRKFEKGKCKINLPEEYKYIVKYRN